MKFISCGLSRLGAPGVEILSIDRGPGIPDLQACFADGFSTTGTPGGGLGAVVRLSSEFDVYSQPGRGSVFVSRALSAATGGSVASGSGATIGALTVPVHGEVVCGDAWALRSDRQRLRLIVSDGLGHGPLPRKLPPPPWPSLSDTTESSPMKLWRLLHRALKGTRGAALAVASIEMASRRIRFAGLGNIAGVTIGGAKASILLSHNGTAGHDSRRIQEFQYPLPDPGLLILHSDGITTSWSLDPYPGLQRRHPSRRCRRPVSGCRAGAAMMFALS